MKKIIQCLLVLAFASLAYADGIDLTNQFGTISVSTAGITSKGSELTGFNGIVAPKGHSLGSVSYTTGALLSGSVAGGGAFSSAGSTFDVTGNGQGGVPKGSIFTGSFIGPIDWTLVSQVGPHLTYTLAGDITGMLYTGRTVTGTTTQTIVSVNGQLAQGIGHIRAGASHLNTPEPGSLMLMGTGLLSVAGVVRRRLQSALNS